MRSSGACSVQQALTTEAASVLKLSLNLARRRGHAQITPLHVAATLLTSPSSPSSNLLRRACLKSHPNHHLASSHPLQCRALELCFNVALNRLPTTPPPSSGSLIQSQPSLSNALIAALKRAQAHQRRGCIEQQQHFQLQQQQQQQQQQPLLAIKVELEQLIISILDDPSVSRVMREAGFSSTTVKSNLEEDSSSSVFSTPSSFFFDSSRDRDAITSGSFLHAHFLKPSPEQNPCSHFSIKEDLRLVFEVMLRRQGKGRSNSNTVVVADSVGIAEGVVNELMLRLERGEEVPDELRSSHFIKLQLSYVHLRLMSRVEVDLKVSDLRRKVSCLATSGVIVYVGDLKWALDDGDHDEINARGGEGFRPVKHLIDEVGKLICEMKEAGRNSGRVWLVASASYQTYMRCQVRHPSLEAQWGLQAVVVPSGGLKLSLQQAPSSGFDTRVTKLSQYPVQMLDTKAFLHKDEEDRLHLCAECTSNFEKESSIFMSDAKDSNSALPYWLQPHKQENHHKGTLLELRRKWNRLCRNLHPSRQSSIHVLPPYPSSNPWWSSLLTDHKNKLNPTSFPESTAVFSNAIPVSANSRPKPWLSDVKTTLALGNPLFSDTATSIDQRNGARANQRELSRKLHENIPWQSETIPCILEALLDGQSKNGTWLLVQGSDQIGKRRLARVAAESFFGSTDKLVYMDARGSSGKIELLTEAVRKDPKCVVLVENIDQASQGFIETISDSVKTGVLKDPIGREVDLSHGIFVLTTSSSNNYHDSDFESHDKVLSMRLWVEEDETSAYDHKRKSLDSDCPSENRKKRLKSSEGEFELDLNICAEESDLTQEMGDGCNPIQAPLPGELAEAIGTTITMDGSHRMEEEVVGRLGLVVVDRTAAEGLRGAMGWFLESEFERWVREVFESSVATVGSGGKKVRRLGVEKGKEGNLWEFGFLGSVLPNRIHVD